MQSWVERMVGELARLRENGVEDFERAWRMALRAHPARLMDCGPRTPRLDDECSVVEFLHAQAGREWRGEVRVDYRVVIGSWAASGARSAVPRSAAGPARTLAA